MRYFIANSTVASARVVSGRPAALLQSLALLLSLLFGTVAEPLDAQGAPATRGIPKVILIGIDGVRPDILHEVLTPRIDALIREGVYSDRARTGLPTLSGPSWTSMLTGVWKEKHGILDNRFPFPANGLGRYPDFLTRIERERPELRTFATANWHPLVEAQEHEGVRGDPVISDALDVKLFFDPSRSGWAATDERSVDAAVRELTENDPDALFVYLGNPDEVSHHTGSIEDEYRASIRRADRHVGRLLDAIRARPRYSDEDWLVLVSTDHGRLPDGGHGGDSEIERTIFFLAHGPSVNRAEVPATPNIVDVAATALRHLGLGPDPAWDLDGTPVGLGRED